MLTAPLMGRSASLLKEFVGRHVLSIQTAEKTLNATTIPILTHAFPILAHMMEIALEALAQQIKYVLFLLFKPTGSVQMIFNVLI